MPGTSTPQSSALDLEALELDPSPTFVIRIGQSALKFAFVYCNEAFRSQDFNKQVEEQERSALLFRSWAQAVGDYRPYHDFAERRWFAQDAGKDRSWKIVRAAELAPERKAVPDDVTPDVEKEAVVKAVVGNGSGIYRRSKSEMMQEMEGNKAVLEANIPRTSLTARWEGLQTMMEMSDVGVFEYNMEGKLIHANQAWYRLSSHPRNLPAHTDFSFMDLVYPEDQALVMSMWNSLASGNPVTFEMRWKAQPGSEDPWQWVLSACVPLLDEEGKPISIAGNTIDIMAQKKSQEVTQTRLEALERARISEQKFARFAELSPTAIYIFVPGQGMNYVNDQFFELTGHPRRPLNEFEWFGLVADEDLQKVEDDWAHMMAGEKSDGVQFRLKKTWVNQDGIVSNIWVQSSNYPELNKDGKVTSILGTLFDISPFKWAETVQTQRTEEALEAKRQQENFDKIREEVSTSIDSLQTIVSCSLHQKRVIDDVLTLSKLDSNLILITPVRVQPAVVVSEALKMFDVECSQMEIKLEFIKDPTFEGCDWVMLDPSRLLQVLINLLTNAIKFTKDRPVRKITVTLGASPTRPPKVWDSVTFTHSGEQPKDLTSGSEWGSGTLVFLWLKVHDTGCGMTHEEQRKLFSRFTQATPRTHVKYGGSGLGLFISKSLATLQGGAIGVSSDPDVGSTFAFYVSTRKAVPPAGQSIKTRPGPQRTESTEQAMRRTRLNILIVEDNLVNQKVLKKQLAKFGWNVSVAGDGQQALDWLKGSVYWRGTPKNTHDKTTEEEQPEYFATPELEEVDIVLMDIEMPIMDGLTCARKIREYEAQGLLVAPEARSRQLSISASPLSSFHDLYVSKSGSLPKAHTRLPILAVSANARMEQVEQALAAGMDDAISKPFRIPELWPKLSILVKRLSEENPNVQ
ncbi:Histidine kinase [Curvularia kusanoi]|uniref:Histidine kinase n=1 Tax=Curvularia kusanoi TaxID=90978 RepID=A0A9P4T5N4_CURKU|nr:Histidine kinase [Curvularia kusanoi]